MVFLDLVISKLGQKKALIACGLFLFLAIGISSLKLETFQAEKKDLYIAPPTMMKHFTLGYQSVMADFFWIRAIQDMDFCEKKLAVNLCQGQGWLYKMLDFVTDLSPNFRMPYAIGAMALSVLVSDIPGATKLFDKAVIAFPNDWPILYRAAYHAIYEEKDNLKAGILLKKAAENGAPGWTYSLAARLMTESGQREMAVRMYEELVQSQAPEEIRKRVLERLKK